MNYETFIEKSGLWSRFPASVHEYAQATAKQLPTAARQKLYEDLERSYIEYVALDNARINHHAETIDQLTHFRKTRLPELKNAIETQERAGAEKILDGAL